MTRQVSKDHVPLLPSIPPQVTISRLVQKLNGRTSGNLMLEFMPLKKACWGRHIWVRMFLLQQREHHG